MDFMSDMMSMFGPKSQKDEAFHELTTIVDCDEESEDAVYSSERIIKSAWDHAARMAADPASVARSLPWNALPRRPVPRGFERKRPEDPDRYLDRLVGKSFILWDSDLTFRFSFGMAADERKERKRLTGKQLYKDHYVDRYLPGVVEPHPEDHRPTNAIAWTGAIGDGCGNWFEWEHYKELARTHPGDNTYDHEKFSQKDSSAHGYCEKDFCPTVTKAGSRLWSISFVAPQSKHDVQCVDMKAVYPGQLTIRYDIGRDLLIYDMFDFKPTTIHDFCNMRANGQDLDLCSEAELTQVERLLRSTKKKRLVSYREWPEDSYSESSDESSTDEISTAESTLRERIDAIGEEKCCHILNYVRFKKSRLMRIRFSLHGLRGIRVLELDCQRPNSDLPPPKGMLPVTRLGDQGENGQAEGHDTFELCDDKIESLGMIVLEFGDECGNSLSSAANQHPFASTVMWPPDWRDRKRLPIEQDWTNNQIFSRSRRHYIVGDISEIIELANFLMDKSSRVFNMLSLPTDEHYTSARKLFNSLSGDISTLNLNQTPSDVFHDPVTVEKINASSSVPTLKHICVDSLIRNFGLKEEEQKKCRNFETAEDVHRFLRRCGIDEPASVNSCLKAGLLNGNLSVNPPFLKMRDASSWLNEPLLDEKCKAIACHGTRCCTIHDVLYQDHVGSENDERENAAVNCGGIFCSARFVADICSGLPRFDRINHNHCTQCPGFGQCIGYYKNRHCKKCGEHYTAGQKCEGCKAKIAKVSRGKEAGDNDHGDTTNPRLSWDGLIKGCFKHELIEGVEKKKAIKDLRERLLMVQTMIQDSSYVKPQLKSKLPDYYDEIMENGCHMKLEDKELWELYHIHVKLLEAMVEEKKISLTFR